MGNRSTLLCGLIIAWACSALAGEKAATRIIDGTQVDGSMFPSVGKVADSDKNLAGFTGTLIAKRFVLSCAHAVINNKLPIARARFLIGGETYNVVKITPHPTYKSALSDFHEGALDLSVIQLDRDVTNAAPSPLYRTKPLVGTALTIVGVGAEGVGATINQDMAKPGYTYTFPTVGKVDYGNTVADEVSGTFVAWHFIAGESNTWLGDSGGPHFINVNNVNYIGSVTANGNRYPGYGDYSWGTRVDIAAEWINSIVNATLGNQAPVIQSTSASPLNPATNAPVTLTVAATDADNDVLSYHWYYGDGSEDFTTSTSVTHSYTVDSIYYATVVVTDSKGGTASSNVRVQVGTGGNAALTVSASRIILHYKLGGLDSLSFSGSIHVNQGFNPDAQHIDIDVGGVGESFLLDASGRSFSQSGKSTLRMSLKKVNGVVVDQVAKFSVLMNRGAFATNLADEGLVAGSPRNSKVTIVYAIVFDGVYSSVQKTLNFNAYGTTLGIAY